MVEDGYFSIYVFTEWIFEQSYNFSYVLRCQMSSLLFCSNFSSFVSVFSVEVVYY